MRKLTGYKHDMPSPVTWRLRCDSRVVFYEINIVDTVMTPDGEMLCVRLKNNVEFNNPNVDVAVKVGIAEMFKKSSHVLNGRIFDPQSPELWYHNEKFWLKAKAVNEHEYYNNKCYLFYEVQVQDFEELLARTCTGYELPDPPPPPPPVEAI